MRHSSRSAEVVLGLTSALPGAISLSRVRVYDWPTVDGLTGGCPHLHTACDEGYLVLAGKGFVRTLTRGGLDDHPLAPDTLMWFSAGTVHRLVAGPQGLELLVVMQNAGLPEAGDAVPTFPHHVLRDPAAFEEAVRLPGMPGGATAERAARVRRDLAVEGFLTLCDRIRDEGPQPLEDYYAAAIERVAPRLAEWRARWEGQALAQAKRTGDRLASLGQAEISVFDEASVSRRPGPRDARHGLCGWLTAWS